MFYFYFFLIFSFKNFFCSQKNIPGDFSLNILSMGDQNNFLLPNNAKIFDKDQIGKDILKNKIIFIRNKINKLSIYDPFKEISEKFLNKINTDFQLLQDFKTLKINPLKFENNKTEEFSIKIEKLEKIFNNEAINTERKIRNIKSILGMNTFREKISNSFEDNKILIGLVGALGIGYLYKKFKK